MLQVELAHDWKWPLLQLMDPQLLNTCEKHVSLSAVVGLKFVQSHCFVICMNLCVQHQLFIVFFVFRESVEILIN